MLRTLVSVFFVCVVTSACASKQEASPVDDTTLSSSVEAPFSVASPANSSSDSLDTGEVLSDMDKDFLTDEGFYNDDAFGDATIAENASSDPLEGWNRFWFAINDTLYIDILKPTYTGYKKITPQILRTGLANVAHTLAMPIRFINAVLQGEFSGAGIELGTFLVNSTLGFAGFVDMTSEKALLVPYESSNSRFGTTLAVWGVPEGPYLVLPFFGPSTIRQGIGLGGDAMASPFTWAAYVDPSISIWASYGVGFTLQVNNLDVLLTGYETLTKSAVEPYIAVREAYLPLLRARLAAIEAQAALEENRSDLEETQAESD